VFYAHGQFSEHVVNAWNFLRDIVDLSSFPRFNRSVYKVDFSRFLKVFLRCFYDMYFIFVVHLVYFVYFVFFSFILKGPRKSLSQPGVSCSESSL